MKKSILLFGLVLTFAACNSNKKSGATDSTTTTATPLSSTTVATYTVGKDLIAKNDCLTCHRLDITLVGPAYDSVAARYTASPAVIDTLAMKVIKGGSGKWGAIAMTPHPSLSMGDSREMIKYILSLKK
jgi:cytochrome c